MSSSPRLFPRVVAATACLAGIGFQIVPAPDGITPAAMSVAGVVVAVVGLWATSALPEYFTAIIFYVLAVTMTGVPREVVFSGFHSSASWIIFGGLIIALAVQTTGLGVRIADVILARIGGSYFRVLAGIVAVGAALALVMPSNTGRIMVMLPIFLALADRLGLEEGGNGRAGIALAVCAGTMFPGFAILPAAVPNMVMAGAAESIHGVRLTYGEYIFALGPPIAVISLVALPFMLWVLFPGSAGAIAAQRESTPLGRGERRLLVVLVVSLALWATDFSHGVSPAWVALGAAVVCMLPAIGVLPASAMTRQVNYAPWFFVTGVIGMGAVVAHSSLGNIIGARLIAGAGLAPGADFANLAVLSTAGTVMGWVATVPGAPAIMTSFVENVATATGWPLRTAILAQTLSWSMALFPYQLPPVVLVMQLAGVRLGQAMRLLVAVTLLSWLVMLPAMYLWWRAIGLFDGG